MTARLLLLLLAFLPAACAPLAPPPAAPVPEISGVVQGDLTLSGAYILTGDLLVPPGRTLTLAPGTTIRVRRAESSKIDPEYLSSATEILVRGTLVAAGTAGAPVVFTPELAGEAGDPAWAGIILDRAAPSAIRHARIDRAEQGILAIAASPQIVANLLRNCRYGIVVQAPGSAEIRDNRIEAGEGGLFVLKGATPTITGNRISGHAEEGLYIDATSRPLLGRNEITANAVGLVLANRELPFERGGIAGNREELRILGGGR